MSVEAINQKAQVVAEINEKLTGATSAVVFEYRGLSVAEITQLRNELRNEGVELKVYKNNLVSRATENTVYEGLKDSLKGPNALAFGAQDAVAPARILANFAKKHDALVLKAGVVEGKLLLTDELNVIAKLPGREGMYSMLLGMLQAPVSKFARVVKAVADAKEANGGAVATAAVEAEVETVEAEAAAE